MRDINFFLITKLKLWCSLLFIHNCNLFIPKAAYTNPSQLLAQWWSPTYAARLW